MPSLCPRLAVRFALSTLAAAVATGCSPAPSPVAGASRDDGRQGVAVRSVDAEAKAARDSGGSATEAALVQWSPQSRCPAGAPGGEEGDGFPKAGIRTFWCHRPSHVTLAAIRALAGVEIFSSGPHGGETLALDAGDTFGHYNPAFVRWLSEHAGPSARGSSAQKATQASYDRNLAPLAEVFWTTYEKARHEPECFAREKAAYAQAIERHTLPKGYYERWFFFMNPYFCDASASPIPLRGATPAFGGSSTKPTNEFYYDNAHDGGVDGDVTKSVVGFWLRRALDGTMEAFADGLKKLLASYDPDLLGTPYRPARPAELTRAFSAGMTAAAACKDAKAKVPTVFVAIKVMPDGRFDGWIKSPAVKGTAQAKCIEAAFNAQQIPAFEGRVLQFGRTVPLR
jgi:hypothetical protein